MMRHSLHDWLHAGASPERDRRVCGMPADTLADDLKEFGYTGGGQAVMDQPASEESWAELDDERLEAHQEPAPSPQTPHDDEPDIDYATRWKDTNEARRKEKERADRLEAELAQARAQAAQQTPAPEAHPNPYEEQLQRIRADFTQQILSLKADDPLGREKYAEAVANLTDKLAEVKVQRTEHERDLQSRAQSDWERNTRAALQEAGLPVTDRALQRFTEKVLGLNHTQPGWDKTMSPHDSYRHVAQLLRDEGGIMTEERRSDIDRANAEHERGAQRVLGYGSRAVGVTRPDSKKPKTIPAKTFVQQLEEAHEARKQRAKRIYEDARR